MHSLEQRKLAVETLIKFDHSYADTIAELGYPNRHSLYSWWKDYQEYGEVRPGKPTRQALGITLVEVGKALNVGFQKVSYAETGRLMSAKFLEEYDTWLKSQLRIVG